MIRDDKVVHPSSDGSLHDSYWASVWRTFRHTLFMNAHDGHPEVFGVSWEADKVGMKVKEWRRKNANT